MIGISDTNIAEKVKDYGEHPIFRKFQKERGIWKLFENCIQVKAVEKRKKKE